MSKVLNYKKLKEWIGKKQIDCKHYGKFEVVLIALGCAYVKIIECVLVKQKIMEQVMIISI